MAAQVNPHLSERFIESQIERFAQNDSSQIYHFGLKPFVASRVAPNTGFTFEKDTSKYYYRATEKLFKEHLFDFSGPDYSVQIDPLLNLSRTHDFISNGGYQDSIPIRQNTRGIGIRVDIGKKVSFNSYFLENQIFFPKYLKTFADSTNRIIPGQGRGKRFGNFGYDFGYAQGTVSFAPNKNWHFELGHGKQFIGHGYRSLLMSYNAFVTPFFKATGWFLEGKIQYTYLYKGLRTATRQPLGEVPESLFIRKGSSTTYLSVAPARWLEIGLFESTVWKRWNDTIGTFPTDYQMFNPVPLVNLSTEGWNTTNNVMLGGNLKITPIDNLAFYGQIAIDDLDSMAMGYQIGAKAFDWPLKNMVLRAEYNTASAGMYNGVEAQANFTHLKQPLGSQLGPDHQEVFFAVDYRYKKWVTNAQINVIKYGTGHHYVYYTGGADRAPEEILYVGGRVAYVVNPSTYFNVYVDYKYRTENDGAEIQNNSLITLGLSMNLFNSNYDF